MLILTVDALSTFAENFESLPHAILNSLTVHGSLLMIDERFKLARGSRRQSLGPAVTQGLRGTRAISVDGSWRGRPGLGGTSG